MNGIDIAIIVILVAFVAFGFYKGFIFSILSLFSTFVNFCIAIALTKPVSNLFNSIFNLEGSLTSNIAGKLTAEGYTTNLVGMTDKEISSHISSTLQSNNFPLNKLFNGLVNITNEKIGDKTSITLQEILSKSLGTFFTLIISFVVIFLLIYLVLFIISRISKKAKEASQGINTTDRILGVIFGLIRGAIVIAFIFVIISFLPENGIFAGMIDYIKQSAIGNFAYTNVNNFVDKYLNWQTVGKAIQNLGS